MASGIYSVLRTGRPALYVGTYADLLQWGQIFKLNDQIIATDLPKLVYRGDGVNTFANLQPSGKVKSAGVAAPLNTTAAAAVAGAVLAAIKAGLITSTSAAAVSIVTPTAAQLAAAFGGVPGVSLEFAVFNSGANAVTLSGGTGVTAITPVITGSDSLVVAAGAYAIFRLVFISATVVKISRVQ